MQTLEVYLPKDLDLANIVRFVELFSGREGLSTTIKTTLKGVPGSIHWHFKKVGEPGTLEVTYSPLDSCLYISVHKNRRARWTEDYMKIFQDYILNTMKSIRSNRDKTASKENKQRGIPS